jgi:hypothetical protein
MKNIKSFIDDKFNYLVLLVLLLIFLKSCSISSNVEFLRKEIKKTNSRIDSIPNKRDLKIEGLKNEKRMIQSTDRRILDVDRQNEIEKELKILNN